MKLLRYLLAGGIVCLATGATANAAPLIGSFALTGSGQVVVDPDATNLLTAESVSMTQTLVTSQGLDPNDYAAIPIQTDFGPLTLTLADAATGFSATGITLTSAFGTFHAESGLIVTQSSTTLDLYILGTFTPAGDLDGFDATKSSLRVLVGNNGGAVSVGLVLTSPPAAIPEPSSMVLAGLGVAGLGLFRVVRHRAAK